MIRALHHALDVDHVVALPVAQFIVTARIVEVWGLPDNNLTHFVDKKTLAPVEQAQYSRGP